MSQGHHAVASLSVPPRGLRTEQDRAESLDGFEDIQFLGFQDVSENIIQPSETKNTMP